MVTKTKYFEREKKRNVTQIAYIQYQLKKNGYTQQDIADELGISKQAVSMAINGKGKVSKVNKWLENNLALVV